MSSTISSASTTLLLSPQSYLLLGHLPQFATDRLAFFTKCAREYGDIVPLKLGPMRVWLLSHPDLVEEVLVKKNRYFIKDIGLRKSAFLGNGLLTSEGDFWLRQRRLAQPAFHRERIGQYVKIMVDYAEKSMSTWLDSDKRDINAEMMKLTLSIATKTLFDVDVDGTEQGDYIGSLVNKTISHFRKQSNTGFLIPTWLPTPGNLSFNYAHHRLDNYISSIIATHRKDNHDRGDLLSMLIAAQDEDGNHMTEKQLLDEVKTMFLAGHETTANALSWTLWLLAQHPIITSKLVSELEEVLNGQAVTLMDLSKLKYCEAVITESMRLMPPAWMVAREAAQACEIGGQEIKVGHTIMMSQWVIHRDARFFNQPDQFIPERWANNFAKELPTYAYFPFGGGQRLCIGKQFAITEAMVILVTLLQKFSFTLLPAQKIEPEPSITLRPKNGIWMKLQKI